MTGVLGSDVEFKDLRERQDRCQQYSFQDCNQGLIAVCWSIN